jgi:catechol 2,3-dioxygenase-like lactoylglutathione lyase family enzyme
VKLTFLFQHVDDLDAAVAFHRDGLGWEETWREAGDTVAFAIPGGDVEVMLSTDPGADGPMYLVDDVDAWLVEHPEVAVTRPRSPIPGGSVVEVASPTGSAFHVFDLSGD